MLLLVLFSSYFAPDLARLGDDDWNIREQEFRRCDHWLLALLLPTSHDDPEVNYRVRQLRTRNLKWLEPVRVERVVLRQDVQAWARLYLITGHSRIAREWDTFTYLHCVEHALALCGVLEGHPAYAPGFLVGTIMPGEYERYLEHLDYHLHIAPEPREVPEPQP